jgi:amino acid transporter
VQGLSYSCPGYLAYPFSNETVFTRAFRRCDPSFPAFLPGSRSLQEGDGCPDHHYAGYLVHPFVHRQFDGQITKPFTLFIKNAPISLLLGTDVSCSQHTLNNVALAAVLGFLSFAGFEGAATLGEETRNPRRDTPLAILAAVVGTGIFYVAVTYTQTVGFGTSAPSVQAFASSTASLGDFGQRNIGGAMTTAIDFGATISAFASALGTANAGARILFSMGRDGFITNRLGTTSRSTSSPAIAVAVVMIFTFAVILLWSRAPGINGATLFGYLGTIGVSLILVAYILTNVGAIRFFAARRLWRWQWVIPVLAILVLGYTLYSNIYPVPAPPFNIFPYIALAWLVVGLLIVLISLALVRSIGLHFEEHAGPVP